VVRKEPSTGRRPPGREPHEDHRAHLSDCGAATTKLRQHIPNYTKKVEFAMFAVGVKAAIERARALDRTGNPSTGVWRLVERVTGE
jgi:hypothetical protein